MAEAAAQSTSAWWSSQRWRYNRGLIIAGGLAFVAYIAIAELCANHLNDLDVTAFTIAFQAVGYLVAMAVANVCFFLGPFAESVAHPRDPVSFRRRLFALGYWFSVALPFVVPITLAYVCLASRLGPALAA